MIPTTTMTTTLLWLMAPPLLWISSTIRLLLFGPAPFSIMLTMTRCLPSSLPLRWLVL
jgi:hypothetical protein